MAKKTPVHTIVAVTDDRERVRLRPELYLPSLDDKGFIHIIYEVVDNSLDELNSKGSANIKKPVIDITYDEATKIFTVRDNGNGIPHDKMLQALTVLNSSGKFHNDEDSYFTESSGIMGIGLKLNTYLSTWADFKSYRNGTCLHYRFEDGIKVKEEKTPTKEHGTEVACLVSDDFINTKHVNTKDIVDRLVEKAYLFPGITFNLTILKDGKEKKKYSLHDKTIMDRIQQWKPDTPIIRVNTTREVTYLDDITDDELSNKKAYMDIVFAMKEAALDTENPMDYLICYGNGVKNYLGGTHLEGLRQGIQKYFKQEVIPKLKGRDKDLNILPSDTIAGLCAFVTVSAIKIIFRGQYKDQVSNQEIRFAVRDAVYDALREAKPNEVNPMIDFVKRVARGRMASKKTRKKDVSNAFSKDRLDKFKDIVYNLETTDCELILVEGDSAADNAATARDPHNQAIYPIRRPANVFDLETSAVGKLKTTFNDVLDICGISAGDKCDPEKSTMNKILMLTDGDVDGDDIAISMVCLLAKHCKPLLDAGMVGRILPPAYAIPTGKNGKKVYVRSQREFFDRILKDFIEKEEVAYKGKVMTKKELRAFLEKNFEYDQWVDKLKDRYCCDPKLIEYIAWYYHGHVKDQKKSYWMDKLKKFPWLSILIEKNDSGNILVLDGDVPGFDYLNLAFDNYFDRYINLFKELQKKNASFDGYSINGEKGKTIYDVMHAMRKHIPDKKIERFKGLGELSPEEMSKLCMDKKHRTVVIFSFKDFKKDMDKINIIMSTKKEFVEARSKLMTSMRASSLDIDT